MPDMVGTIQSLPFKTVDVDEWARSVRELMQRVPPRQLLSRLDSQRRRSLPVTSPLLHYPHPWMRPEVPIADGDWSKLAPVYLPNGGVNRKGFLRRLAALPSILGQGGTRLVSRALGLGAGGGLLAAALALLLRAWGMNDVALSLRSWAKR